MMELEAEAHATHLINDDLTDAEVLLETRRVKSQLIQHLTANGMPNEAKDVGALMKVIDSVDRVAQTNIRNNIEQDSNQAVSEALAIIAVMQQQVGNVDPFMVDVNAVPVDREVKIETQLVEHDFVEGELSNEIKDLTYDPFVTGFEANPPKY